MAESATVYKEGPLRVEWNGSATFNIFDGKNNVDVWTTYDVNTKEEAEKVAREHMSDWQDESGESEGHWYTR